MDNIQMIGPSIDAQRETRNLIELLMDYSVRDGTRIEWREEAKTLAMKLAAMSGQTFFVAEREGLP